VPTGAEDIGTWLDILQITSVISVVTNAALVCYTMQLTSDYSDVGQLWIFIGFQYTIFITMYIFAEVVDDMPEEVRACPSILLAARALHIPLAQHLYMFGLILLLLCL
jgi:hypothetical protein